MLSYRHAYHAGNHADVLKHFVLYLVLHYFNQKDKPYWYIDTHSGAGAYDLRGNEAQKIGEYRQGIARLHTAHPLPERVRDFMQHLTHILPEHHLYAGSPYWAQSLLRETDKMRLFELHPNDYAMLLHNLRNWQLGRRAIAKQEDGFNGLLTLLPPPTRRGIILIDPPYEQKHDYARVVQTIKEALKRFETGCYMIWYPCLSRKESQELPEQLQKLLPENYLRTELHVHRPRADGFGMHGSGMYLFNPPYILTTQLANTLPTITQQLAQDEGAHFILDYRIK